MQHLVLKELALEWVLEVRKAVVENETIVEVFVEVYIVFCHFCEE